MTEEERRKLHTDLFVHFMHMSNDFLAQPEISADMPRSQMVKAYVQYQVGMLPEHVSRLEMIERIEDEAKGLRARGSGTSV
jgi:hypothetical protein